MREHEPIPDRLAEDLCGLLGVWRNHLRMHPHADDFSRDSGFLSALECCANQLADTLARYGNINAICADCKTPVVRRGGEWTHADASNNAFCSVIRGLPGVSDDPA